MSTFHENLKTCIQNNKYEEAHNQFQEYVHNQVRSSTEVAMYAHYCLYWIGESCMMNNSCEKATVKTIYDFANSCCENIFVKFDGIKNNFHVSIFRICQYLLKSGSSNKAIIIGEYFYSCFDGSDSNISEENLDIILSFIRIYAKHVSQIDVSCNIDDAFNIWNFILSSSCNIVKAKSKNLAYLISKFGRYICITGEKLVKNSFELQSTLDKLNDLINIAENIDELWLKFICIIIYHVCKYNSDNSNEMNNVILTFIRNSREKELQVTEQVEKLKESYTVKQVCEDLYLFHMAESNNDQLSTLVKNISDGLKSFEGKKFYNQLIFFASVVISRKRNVKRLSHVLEWDNFFSIISNITNHLKDVCLGDIMPFTEVQTEEIKKQTVLKLILLLNHNVLLLENFDARIPNITSKHTIKFISDQNFVECYFNQEINGNTGLQILREIESCQVDICRKFIKNKSYKDGGKLIFRTLRFYDAYLSNHFNNNLTDNCVKLVEMMVLCYRELEYYKDSIHLSLWWALRLPTCKDFMQLYCKTKKWILNEYPNIDEEISNVTCVDVKSFKKIEIHVGEEALVNICITELKLYAEHNIIVECPVLKLVEYIDRCEFLPIYKRIDAFCHACYIYLSSPDTLPKAKQLLSKIEEFISMEMKQQSKMKKEILSAENHSVLANSYFIKFKTRLLEYRIKNEVNVNLLKSTQQIAENEKNTKDYVTPSYTYETEKELLSDLNSAVMYWNKLITHKENSISLLNSKYMREAATVYRLYCDEAKEIETWEMLYKIAQHRNDDELVVYAFINLMNTNFLMDNNLIKHVEERYLPKVRNRNLKAEFQLIYWNKYAKNSIMGVPHLEKLQSIISEVNDNITLAKYYFILSQIRSLRTTNDLKQDFYRKSSLAYDIISSDIKKEKFCNFADITELQCLVLDVGFFIINNLLKEYNVSLAKLFLREMLTLIQKLGLSIRTCKFLCLSARIDSHSRVANECNFKLSYICRILDMKMYEMATYINTTVTSLPILQYKGTTHRYEVDGFRCAPVDNDFDYEGLSPAEEEIHFQTPEFFNHKCSCRCETCGNREYITAYTNTIFELSQYFIAIGRMNLADEYFKGTFKLMRRFNKYFDDVVLAFILSKYADFLSVQNNTDNAVIINSSLKNICNLPCPMIAHEINEQMWQLKESQSITTLVKEKRIVRLRRPITKLTAFGNASAYKTPEKNNNLVIPCIDNYESNAQYAEKQLPSITPLPSKNRKKLFLVEGTSSVSTRKKRQNVTSERKKEPVSKSAVHLHLPDVVLQLPSLSNFPKLNCPPHKSVDKPLVDDYNVFSPIQSKSDLISSFRKMKVINEEAENISPHPSNSKQKTTSVLRMSKRKVEKVDESSPRRVPTSSRILRNHNIKINNVN